MAIQKKAICILGMHRSGTSVLARAVNLLGVYAGPQDRLLQPNEYNIDGYWEHQEIVNLNDRLLKLHSKSWDSILPMPEGWWELSEITPYRREAINIINENFGERQLWVWKDPRTSVLLPFWVDLLRQLKIEVYFLISIRNPLDVVASLEKRDGFKKEKSLALWQYYNLSSLYWTCNSRRMVIHYDSLLDNWESYLKAITKEIGIPYFKWKKPEYVTFLRPELRHSKSNIEDLIKDRDIPQTIIYTYNLFCEIDKRKRFLLSEEFAKEITKLYLDYSGYVAMLNHLVGEDNSTDIYIQLFFPEDNQYSEENSVRFSLTCDGLFHVYDFPLPSGKRSTLRLDPINIPAFIEIKAVELFSGTPQTEESELVFSWNCETGFSGFSPSSGIVRMEGQNYLSMFSLNNDPIIYLEGMPPLNEKRNYTLRVVIRVEKKISNKSAIIIANEINNHNMNLTEKTGEILRLQKELDLQTEQVTVLQAELKESVKQISLWKVDLKEKVEQINLLQEQLKEKVAKYDLLQSEVKEMTAQFELLNKKFKGRDELLVKKLNEAKELRIQIDFLNNQIDIILNSWSWKITAPFRRIKSFAKGKL